MAGRPRPSIFPQPPFICIEVLSKDDTLARMQDRIDDYLKFGVPYREIKDGVPRTENPSIEVSLAEVFAGLDGTQS